MTRTDLVLACQAGPLSATLVEPDDATEAGVLFVHGLGSDRLTNIERAQALALGYGITGLAIDLRGHGASPGRLSALTPRENLADLMCAYDALLDHAVVPERVGVCAASYGAYLSVLLAARRPVARLLLRAPALYSDDSIDRPLGRRRHGDGRSAPDLLRVLAGLSARVLVVESERDEVISPQVISSYVGARHGIEHALVPGAGHALTDPVWRQAYLGIVRTFFADL